MSTSTSLPTAGPESTTVRNTSPSVTTLPRRPGVSPSDAPITHAWSIGTTRIAQERPAMRRKEECPPEVYIG